jgi:hypothetical protein
MACYRLFTKAFFKAPPGVQLDKIGDTLYRLYSDRSDPKVAKAIERIKAKAIQLGIWSDKRGRLTEEGEHKFKAIKAAHPEFSSDDVYHYIMSGKWEKEGR